MMIGGGVGVVLICKTVKPCVYKKGQDLYTHGFTNNMVLQISTPPIQSSFLFKKERVKTTSTVYECTKHLVYEKVIRE